MTDELTTKRFLVTTVHSVEARNENDAIELVRAHQQDSLHGNVAFVESHADEVEEVVVTLDFPDGTVFTWRKQLALLDEEGQLKRQLETVLGEPSSISS